jgi:hypothetical protein
MVYSDPRQSFGITFLLFSGYLENSGEVLLKFYLGSDQTMETNPIYASSDGIRTYPHLLDSRNVV